VARRGRERGNAGRVTIIVTDLSGGGLG